MILPSRKISPVLPLPIFVLENGAILGFDLTDLGVGVFGLIFEPSPSPNLSKILLGRLTAILVLAPPQGDIFFCCANDRFVRFGISLLIDLSNALSILDLERVCNAVDSPTFAGRNAQRQLCVIIPLAVYHSFSVWRL